MKRILCYSLVTASLLSITSCGAARRGEAGLTKAADGGIAAVVAWCGDTPEEMEILISPPESGPPRVTFATAEIGDSRYLMVEFAAPSSGWRVVSGDPALNPAEEYVLQAHPAGVADVSFGRTPFRLDDVGSLEPGQILVGEPGQVYSKEEFIKSAAEWCA